MSICLILSPSIAPSVSALTESEDTRSILTTDFSLREREMLLSDLRTTL